MFKKVRAVEFEFETACRLSHLRSSVKSHFNFHQLNEEKNVIKRLTNILELLEQEVPSSRQEALFHALDVRTGASRPTHRIKIRSQKNIDLDARFVRGLLSEIKEEG